MDNIKEAALTPSHNKPSPPPRCRLLELPTELRDQIWDLAVSDWIPLESSSGEDSTTTTTSSDTPPTLVRARIRIDRFNHTAPTSLTRTSSQIRRETLQRYYALNTFESWRPRFKRKHWVYPGSLVPWLRLLGESRRAWLSEVVLLHKANDERIAEEDVEGFLEREGLGLRKGVVRQAVLVDEQNVSAGGGFEQLGLPGHFGEIRKPRR
jgi:hypothetical protein